MFITLRVLWDIGKSLLVMFLTSAVLYIILAQLKAPVFRSLEKAFGETAAVFFALLVLLIIVAGLVIVVSFIAA